MTAGRTNHTKFAAALMLGPPQGEDVAPGGVVTFEGPEPVEHRGKLTLARDGSWVLQFADAVTIMPGETFEFVLRKVP